MYDPPEVLARFTKKHEINLPLLSDPKSAAISQLGLLNRSMDTDTKYDGVPYPGVLLIDGESVIIGKFAEENYRKRPLMEDLMRAVNELN